MKVKAVWEDCSLLNGEWGDQKVTSYWMEVDESELPAVLAYVSEPEKLLEDIEMNKHGDESTVYLLVSKNLESISSFPSYYPNSGQWNARSPFREVSDIDIQDLKDLASL